MVNQSDLIKSKYFLKRELFLAITLFVIVFSFSANFAFASQTKINAEQVERIQTALNLLNTVSNFGSILVDGGGLMKALNTVIKGGQTATDVTYGLLVLSAINEMEFIDLVISQDYKDKAREYFTNILDERTKLTSYWKGVGFDIPKVVSGQITGPMAALSLNTFEMTDKVILILTAFNNLRTELRYDGLWRYFDERMHGESHLGAWELAEPQMGFAAKSNPFVPQKLTKNNYTELEDQFLALWEKWGPHTTPFGVSEEYRQQAKDDLRNTVAIAVEEYTETRSLYAEKPSLLDKLLVQLENIKNAVANLVSKADNPFSAGPIIEPPEVAQRPEARPRDAEEVADIGSPQEEMMDIGYPLLEPDTALTPESTPEPMPESTPAHAPTLESEPEESMEVEPPLIDTGRQLCQKGDGGLARQYRVLINEVAWMGDADSPNNEWIELKNIWGIPVNLAGWQLQDKDQQIKVIFEENDAIPAGDYLVLERSKHYTGALNNTDEAIYLFDNNCQLEDEVLANPDWPGGDNSLKKTMQRFDVLYWYTGVVSAGSENSPPPAVLIHPSAPAAELKVVASTPSYPEIIITEVGLGSPGNEKDDFVELYNPNSEAVSLTDWYMQRKTETGQNFSSYAPASLFSGKTIGPKSYFLIANASSSLSAELIDLSTTYSLTDNNTLVFKNPNQEIADEVSTGNPPASKSFGRKWSPEEQKYLDEFEIQIPTPRAQNGGLVDDDDDDNAGVESLAVVFNEIAWMGTKANSSDEWMELYNTTGNDINLAGWKIKKDGEDWIEFSAGAIPAKGYFLFERTDDNTVKDIVADQIYTGALGNGDEILELYDNADNLIDSIDASSDWPAGDNQNKQTMERVNPLLESDSDNWADNNKITRNGLDADNNAINGTPKAENSASKAFTEIQGVITVEEDLVMTRLGSPYLIEGSINVLSGIKLTIEPGVIIKFKYNVYWKSQLKVAGEIEAIGGKAENEKIIFTSSSTEPLAGDWDGLYFEEGSSGTLKNTTVSYAGKLYKSCCYEYTPYTYGAVYIDGGEVRIENSSIEKIKTLGIWLKNSTSTLIDGVELADIQDTAVYIENSNPTIKNSTFKNNNIGILVTNFSAPIIQDNTFENNQKPIKLSTLLPVISGNTAKNNNFNGILFSGFGFSDKINEINWLNGGLPYILDGYYITLPAGKILNIEPGVILKLPGNYILVEGKLLAKGTEENPIVFTSFSDDEYGGDTDNSGLSEGRPGSWRYLYFAPTSDAVLKNAIIRYGGFVASFGSGAPNRGAIIAEEGLLTISNSLIENNLFVGIELINSNPVIKNTIFRRNNVQYSYWGYGDYSKGLYLINSNPDLNGSSFERNYHGIFAEGGCPDLSGVKFGKGDNANTYDIYPSSCK